MKPLTPKNIASPFGGYSHGVSGGGVVLTSGQLGLAADGTVPATVTEQAEICFENIRAILACDGLDFSHILRFSAYVTAREHMADYMKVRDAMVSELAVKPASTLMIVSGFTRAEFLVEVEATALAPTARSSPK
ncbi:RidA family protein [Falsihalocynthiibacter arcticus]|uniref:Enamine deaminase RidA n=1 Tax=Falsihalocynthiibacter arcticus TaxID=1579316 RepID=A0A126UYK5_9RHOB|nr:RidA family protein [Falsihalocynthiibacter arcticus]AML51141.1 enamine deaminase RidA [Falsihalocynthiibacter arcticus]